MSPNSTARKTATIIANGFQEDYIVNLCNSLSEFTNVHLIGSDIYEKYDFDDAVKLINLRGDHSENVSHLKKVQRILGYYLKLLSYIFKTKSKAIHIQWLRFYLIDGFIFTWIIRMLGKNAVYTAHDVVPHDKDTSLNRWIFRRVYKSQSTIIVHTGFIKQRLIDEFNIKESRITLVKHGVYEVPDNKNIKRELSREKFSINQDDFVILFFGWIAKYKGLELLLEAFNNIKKNAKVTLLVAGKIHKDYEEELNALLKKVNLDKVITLLRHIENDEVEELFKACDVCAIPYLEASQSGVMFLSYAYGRAVIAPELGGFPYDIELNKTGLLFKTGNTKELEKAISIASEKFSGNNVEQTKSIKQYALDNYSWQASAMNLNNVYTA